MISLAGATTFQYAFVKTGKKHVIKKGIMLGTSLGCVIPGVISVLPMNKVGPTDASSNLSYIVSHSFFGIATALALTILGDDTVFSSRQVSDQQSTSLPQKFDASLVHN